MPNFDALYLRQVELLLKCLPAVGQFKCFALKGGTAINLFVQSMPRLSVDIDLTYLPLSGRAEALNDISVNIESMASAIRRQLYGTKVTVGHAEGKACKLIIRQQDIQIKVETNTILRGSVYGPLSVKLCPEAQSLFSLSANTNCLSKADLYGGKICAALDRQHPRDLFDIRMLMDDGGITPDIRRAFVVYLASHDRPMSELLAPKLKDLQSIYTTQFAGMARVEIPLDELYSARETLISTTQHDLDTAERRFLLSIKSCEPDWDILGIQHLKELPAIQWKLHNLRKMDRDKRIAAADRLKRILDR